MFTQLCYEVSRISLPIVVCPLSFGGDFKKLIQPGWGGGKELESLRGMMMIVLLMPWLYASVGISLAH